MELDKNQSIAVGKPRVRSASVAVVRFMAWWFFFYRYDNLAAEMRISSFLFQ